MRTDAEPAAQGSCARPREALRGECAPADLVPARHFHRFPFLAACPHARSTGGRQHGWVIRIDRWQDIHRTPCLRVCWRRWRGGARRQIGGTRRWHRSALELRKRAARPAGCEQEAGESDMHAARPKHCRTFSTSFARANVLLLYRMSMMRMMSGMGMPISHRRIGIANSVRSRVKRDRECGRLRWPPMQRQKRRATSNR